jgi:hypothetical protein|tara:strand:+ start:1822 stop:2463 length:642 start_codon:yes stop_codon:yes gene_type:complete
VNRAILFFFLLLIGVTANSQIRKDTSLLQFSGVFLDSDSLIPVPWVNIEVINRNEGTTTDYNGTFSFVAHAGDTVRFTCIGYKPFQCIIPDSLTTKRFTLVQLFSRDTHYLPEAVIFPWPSKDQFREAFLNLHIPDDDMERAKKNLAWMERKAAYEEFGNDGRLSFIRTNNAYTEKLYYAGQAPPLSIFSPFAWAEFFKALKDGSLKDRNKEK